MRVEFLSHQIFRELISISMCHFVYQVITCVAHVGTSILYFDVRKVFLPQSRKRTQRHWVNAVHSPHLVVVFIHEDELCSSGKVDGRCFVLRLCHRTVSTISVSFVDDDLLDQRNLIVTYCSVAQTAFQPMRLASDSFNPLDAGA